MAEEELEHLSILELPSLVPTVSKDGVSKPSANRLDQFECQQLREAPGGSHRGRTNQRFSRNRQQDVRYLSVRNQQTVCQYRDKNNDYIRLYPIGRMIEMLLVKGILVRMVKIPNRAIPILLKDYRLANVKRSR